MKETLESVAIMIGIIVVAEVINEVVGYKMLEVDFSKQSPKKRKCN